MALAHLSGPGQTVCSTATLRRSRTCLFHHTRDSRGTCCQCPSRSPTREFPLTRNRTASSFPATLAAPRCQRSLWRAHGARTRSGRVDCTGESESRDRRDPGRQHADDREAHREHAVQIRLYLAGTDRGVGQRKRAGAKRAEPALKRRPGVRQHVSRFAHIPGWTSAHLPDASVSLFRDPLRISQAHPHRNLRIVSSILFVKIRREIRWFSCILVL